MSIATNLDFLTRLPKLADVAGERLESPLHQVEDFGANPGNLTMWCYVPPDLPPSSPLVVVLHGCAQTAAAFDHGTGWTDLASRHGFAVLMPEQQRANNPNLCFNWFDPEKTARGGGEVLSIHRMIAAMVRLHRVSARRIFIVGLSAGGAMASAMLAAYPEVFAAGAIIAGLPSGVAGNLREALAAMSVAPAKTDDALGSFVRDASSHQGPWPRISVWHGTADRVVNPANADQIVQQWRNVHGFPPEPIQVSDVDGHSKAIWSDATGKIIIESYSIGGMAHGIPLSVSGDETFGAPGPFMLDAGIASTLRIAEFFELVPVSHADVSAESLHHQEPAPPFEVSALIKRALAAAGFMK